MTHPATYSSTQPDAPATDAPTCRECGSLMVRTGHCHTCPNCGLNDGCG